MKRIFILLTSLQLLHDVTFAQSVWLNEIDYDMPGTDTTEFVEIAGVAGTDLEGYKLVFINGTNESTYVPYDSTTLSGTIPSQSNGFGAVAFYFPPNTIQNGGRDGIALVKGEEVVQFVSYEGEIPQWVYKGSVYTSQNISTVGDSPTSNVSLQVSGSNVLEGASWILQAPSPNLLNVGQTNIVLALDPERLSEKSLSLSPDAIIYSVSGQRVELHQMQPMQVYIVHYSNGGIVTSRKVLFHP